jgi:hypothetical protein
MEIQQAQGYMRDVEKTVESAERSFRELEASAHVPKALPRSTLDRLKKEEALHKEVLARLLLKHDWAEALRVMEQRSDKRRNWWEPVAEEEDLKVVLRSRILATMLEAGLLAEASKFLHERATRAHRRIVDLRTDLRARNRLRQGQVDMVTGKARGNK